MTTTNLTKRQQLEQTLLELVKDYPVCVRLAQALFADEELSELQDYCNNVSIRRLGFNDHGPVHMRQVAVNATRLLFLLRDAGLRTSLETEEYGTFEDSLCAVLLAGFCHDLGMSVGRQQHEDMSALYVLDASRRLLTEALPDDLKKSYMDTIPLKRFGSVDDVAKAVAWLASDDASYVTGQIVSVNGGMV